MNYKKLTIFLLLVTFTFSFISCSKNEVSKSNKFTIVTSFYPMYIFTKNIVDNIPDVEVFNMTEPQTGCLHDYQLSTKDMKTLETANVFVINGAGMESFLDKVTNQIKNIKVIEASKGIDLISESHENEHDKDHEHEDAKATHADTNKESSEEKNHDSETNFNPHVWVGISNAIKEVKNIYEELSIIDTKNSVQYKQNGEKYIKTLEDLKEKMHSEIKNLPNKNVVTFHESFPYFAKEFNLNVVGVIEKEPGQEPTAEELANTIKLVKEQNIKALFTEEQYSPKAAQTISKATGAKLYTFDLVVTGPKDAPSDTYVKAMEKNLELLKEALK